MLVGEGNMVGQPMSIGGSGAKMERQDVTTTGSEKTVDAQNIHKSFGQLHVLKGVSLEVNKGNVSVIVGPSGSGKSTFLRCVNFLEEYEEGRLYVNGNLVGYREAAGRLVKLPDRALYGLRADVAMVFQRFNLFPHLTALQNIMLGPLKTRKLSRADATDQAVQMMRRVGLEDKLNEYPNRLSGGQQQRVAIARALAMAPKVMLFDEVTSALDPELVEEVLVVIREIAAESAMTMIIVTHEMQFAKEVANEVTFMDAGMVVERGSPHEIFENPKTERLQSFLRRFNKQRKDKM
jgi:polar amino acid transport system ATP-binding protein